MARPIKEILNSDINYFEKKVNKYKNQQITIKKELKELRKNSAQNVDAILKKLEYLDNLNNTVIRHERILEYLKIMLKNILMKKINFFKFLIVG